MNRKMGLVLSICTALIGLSAMLFGVSHFSVMAEQPTTPAAAIVVDTLDDDGLVDGDCSLREAIVAANTNASVDACPAGDEAITDTISFDVAGTITLTEQLSVTAGGALVIDGESSITVNGNDSVRAFYVNTGADATLSNLTIADGLANGDFGGGIFNWGSLVITNSILSGNRAVYGSGGGIYNYYGTLSIVNSTLSGNSVDAEGGGGGIFNTFGTLTVTNSTLSGNSAADLGGGIYIYGGTLSLIDCTLWENSARIGGGILNSGTLVITYSTLSGNSSVTNGGGIENWGSLTITNSILSGNSSINGGGIEIGSGKLTMTSCTLSGNTATYNGGGINIGEGVLTMSNSTLWGNSAGSQGGGIYNSAVFYTLVTLRENIIANSPSGGNCAGQPIIDAGYNLEDTDTCGLDPFNGSLPNTNPLLGPLQDNGGPTWTHALLVDSPAIDAGDNAACTLTDQRGVPRPLDGNGDGEAVCDMGAYEAAISPSMLIVSGSSEGISGQPYTFTAQVSPITTTLPVEYSWQASGQDAVTHTGGLSDTLAYTWDNPGAQLITVTAANFGGSVVATHTLTINDVPISGLLASSDSPTLLGESTTFTATVEGGTNLSYAWDFGDDFSASGVVVTHTYAAAGAYTATVTASNSVGSLQASTLVHVEIPETRVYLPVIPQGASTETEGIYWRRQE